MEAARTRLIWSGQVFSERPSAGVAAVVTMNGLGLLIGPPVVGLVADQTGFAVVFAAAAVLLVMTTAFGPRERLQ